MRRPTLLAIALVALAGCGGGGGGGGSKRTESITITSTSSVVLPNSTLALTAIVKGGGKVTWSVDGGDANGTVSDSGVYTAPATQGNYTVRATAGGVSATKAIAVTNGVAILLTGPTTIPLLVPRSKLSFTASVTGPGNKNINWTTTGGTVATDGTYTAPNAPGTYTVTAASVADPSKTASATVVVAATVNVRVKWQGKDDVVLALRADKAPNTVANYVTLVNKGFYDGIVVHRYGPEDPSPIDIVQWGDPLTKTLPLTDGSIGTGGPGYTIPFEVTGLSNVKYSLAMARKSASDSAGSQVYVNLSDNLFLDHKEDDPATPDENEFVQGYVVFGEVASGQAVIDALRKGDKIVSVRTEAP